MHQIRFRLGLRAPRLRWGSLQRYPRPPSWLLGGPILLRERRKGQGKREKGKRGRKRERSEERGEKRGRKGRQAPPTKMSGYAIVNHTLNVSMVSRIK